MEHGGKVSLHRFSADQVRGPGKKRVLGIQLQNERQVLACCQTHSDYGPSKMPLKVAP